MAELLSIPRSVEWNDTHITILNQQKLPFQTEYLELKELADVWDAIATLKVRGAPAIGITAAYAVSYTHLTLPTTPYV